MLDLRRLRYFLTVAEEQRVDHRAVGRVLSMANIPNPALPRYRLNASIAKTPFYPTHPQQMMAKYHPSPYRLALSSIATTLIGALKDE